MFFMKNLSLDVFSWMHMKQIPNKFKEEVGCNKFGNNRHLVTHNKQILHSGMIILLHQLTRLEQTPVLTNK